MKKVDVLLGLQWGDEGKGKIVDVLTPKYDIVARFQGGPNAGHTLMFGNKTYVLRSIPSGIFQGNKKNVIGNGVVLDPILLKKEIEELQSSEIEIYDRLYISKKAHLIMPTHRMLDMANEYAKGEKKIGTTGKGIGPTYTDKISRSGIRVGDIESNFKEKYEEAKKRHIKTLESLKFDYSDVSSIEKEWFEAIEFMKKFRFVDSEYMFYHELNNGKTILAEGAQGSLLDIDFGSYPFVTSSNTVCAGSCTGLGISPNKIGEVFGIFKAYCTRVGSGPFPTELFDETGEKICANGHEYGAVTGRKRRCGWLDLVALKYSVMINGVTQLIMMKSDVLDSFDTIKVCTSYVLNGKETSELPYDINCEITPVYKTFDGWKTDCTKINNREDIPENLKAYMQFIEKEVGVPITIMSVGPDRSQIIFL